LNHDFTSTTLHTKIFNFLVKLWEERKEKSIYLYIEEDFK